MRHYSPRHLVPVMFITKLFHITCAILLLITIFIPSCKKDAGITSSTRSNLVQVVRNTAPNVYAGENKYLGFLEDSCLLIGKATDKENNIASYYWKKLTGPAGSSIDNPNSQETKVRGLQMGGYSFELTATDLLGLQGRDTVKVSVLQIGQNEMIFKDLEWNCFWGCSVSIEDFYSFIPRDKPFLVFLRKTSLSPWELVNPYDPRVITAKYFYDISDNKLFGIYADDETGKVDVKIQY